MKRKILKEKCKDMNRQTWKYKNKEYLRELQMFFDRVDNIQDDELRLSVIRQMLLCDETLTKIAEEMFNKCYEDGYKNAKQG